MLSKFRCGGCQAPITAPAEMAGRQAKCPKCGQLVVIPAAATPASTGSNPTAPGAFDPAAGGAAPRGIPVGTPMPPAMPQPLPQPFPQPMPPPGAYGPAGGNLWNDLPPSPAGPTLGGPPRGGMQPGGMQHGGMQHGGPPRRAQTAPKAGGSDFSLPPMPVLVGGGGVLAIVLMAVIYASTRSSGVSTKPQPSDSKTETAAAATPPTSTPNKNAPPSSQPAGNPPQTETRDKIPEGVVIVGEAEGRRFFRRLEQQGNASFAPGVPAMAHGERPAAVGDDRLVGAETQAASAPVKTSLDGEWKVEVDPPAEAPATSATAAPAVGGAPAAPVEGIRIESPLLGQRDGLMFPSSTARFAAFVDRSGREQSLTFYDVAAQRRLGTLANVRLSVFGSSALSPDGKYFAASDSPGFTDILAYWTTDGKPGRQAALQEVCQYLEFAGGNRLIGGGRSNVLRLWRLPGLQPQGQLEVAGSLENGVKAVSPGGRFFALADRGYVRIYDLGKKALGGVIGLPDTNALGSETRIHSMAWSPNGGRLAVSATIFQTTRLLLFDAGAGGLQKQMEFDDFQQSRIRPTADVQWSEDGSLLWVLNKHLIDPTLDAPLWTQPSDGFDPRGKRQWLLGNHTLLTQEGAELSVEGPRSTPALTSRTISAPMLAEGRRRLVLESTPPMSNVHAGGAPAVKWPADFDWSAAPDPAVEPPELVAEAKIPSPHEIDGVLLSSPSAAKAVFWRRQYADPETREPFADEREEIEHGRLTLQRFDMTTGRLDDELGAPTFSTALDLSPSGDRIASTRSHGGLTEVASFGSGEPIARWRPYGHAAPTAKASDSPDSRLPSRFRGFRSRHVFRGETDPRQVFGASFVDDDHVATLNAAGDFVLWELPGPKPLYAVDGLEFVCRSPGRAAFAAFRKGRLYYFDAHTGALQGAAPAEGRALAAAFSPDGTRLAAVLENNAQAFVREWDVVTGEPTQEIPLSHFENALMQQEHRRRETARTCRYCGLRCLLVGDILFDLRTAAPAARYGAVRTIQALDGWDGRVGIVEDLVDKTADSRPFHFYALPHPEVLAELETITAPPPPPEPPILLQIGEAVQVEVGTLEGLPGGSKLPDQIRKTLTDGLQRAGYRVQAGASKTLSLRTSWKSGDHQLEGNGGPFNGDPEFYCEVRVEVRLTGLDRPHRVIEFHARSGRVPASRVPESQRIASHVGLWLRVDETLYNHSFPAPWPGPLPPKEKVEVKVPLWVLHRGKIVPLGEAPQNPFQIPTRNPEVRAGL